MDVPWDHSGAMRSLNVLPLLLFLLCIIVSVV